MNSTLWHIMPYGLVFWYHCFGGTSCLHLQVRRVIADSSECFVLKHKTTIVTSQGTLIVLLPWEHKILKARMVMN